MKLKQIFKLFITLQLFFVSFSFSQDMQKSLFGDVDKKVEEALEAKLNLLSPANFERAYNFYTEAKADFKEGENLKDIQGKINNVSTLLELAKEKSEVSKITLKSSMKARNDALTVEAEKMRRNCGGRLKKNLEMPVKKLKMVIFQMLKKHLKKQKIFIDRQNLIQ